MKDNVLSLLVKKGFMSKILKMKKVEEIRKTFNEEGVDISNKDVISLVKNLEEASSNLENFSQEEIDRLSENAQNIDPDILKTAGGGKEGDGDIGGEHATDLDLELARMQHQGQVLGMVGNVGQAAINAGLQWLQNREDEKNEPPPQPQLVSMRPRQVVGDGSDGSGSVNKAYVGAAVVAGAALVGLAALYRKEIKVWLSK